jgi:hypothetical protein
LAGYWAIISLGRLKAKLDSFIIIFRFEFYGIQVEISVAAYGAEISSGKNNICLHSAKGFGIFIFKLKACARS